ncbi:MAG TPA: hypothetical protein VEQ11_03115, partial [Chloroflexota bacterium]|nr:hypothetical protein [Chloroflexota bacterium]
RGLYASNQTASGFEVHELQGGTSGVELAYRVVARRKDIPGPRLEKVKLPEPIKELIKPGVSTALPAHPEPADLRPVLEETPRPERDRR